MLHNRKTCSADVIKTRISQNLKDEGTKILYIQLLWPLILLHKLALEPLFLFLGNTMTTFYVLTNFCGCVLSWLTTLNLDRGNDRSFDIYYHNFPMGTCLKHFTNTYRCVCGMKSTSIDGLDVRYIRPWVEHILKICFPQEGRGGRRYNLLYQNLIRKYEGDLEN